MGISNEHLGVLRNMSNLPNLTSFLKDMLGDAKIEKSLTAYISTLLYN